MKSMCRAEHLLIFSRLNLHFTSTSKLTHLSHCEQAARLVSGSLKLTDVISQNVGNRSNFPSLI